jgi:hypothetical protein
LVELFPGYQLVSMSRVHILRSVLLAGRICSRLGPER